MRFLKCRWSETRDDEFDDWGFVTFYLEIDENLFSRRQIEIYDNGNFLKYDYEHQSDKFGMLADQSLKETFEDANFMEISQDEFESVWDSQKAFNKE